MQQGYVSPKRLGVDSPLNEEQTSYLDKQVVKTAQPLLMMRKLFPKGPTGGGLGIRRSIWYEVGEMTDGYISFEFEENQDAVDMTKKSVEIPLLAKEWEISFRDWKSWQMQNILPDTALLQAATRKVVQMEEDYLLYGWAPDGSNYQIEGLYTAAGQTTSGSDFGTNGNAVATVGAAMALLVDANINPPYDLMLNSAQWLELLLSKDNYGNRELPMVRSLLNGGDSDNVPNGKGNIYMIPKLAAGTGMVIPTNRSPDLWDYQLIEDMRTTSEELEKTHRLFGRVYFAGVPRIKYPDAACTLTGI